MRISDWSADVCSSDLRVRYFMRIGGDATVRSYWRDGASYAAATFEEVAERLPHLVPEAHVQFLGMGEDVVEIGEYAFVHAGIRPGVPLDKQALTDLRWRSDEHTSELQSLMRLSYAVFCLNKQKNRPAN